MPVTLDGCMLRPAFVHASSGLKSIRPPLVVLGFDYGLRRTGVAVGQMITGTATPLTTLRGRADGPDWEAIGGLIRTWKPDAIVVGEPGAQHQGARAIRAAIADFQRQLRTRFDLPVYAADEAYSSTEAYERLKSQRRVRADGRRMDKGDIDRVAAAIVLEAWMSSAAAQPEGEQDR